MTAWGVQAHGGRTVFFSTEPPPSCLLSAAMGQDNTHVALG